MNECVPSFRQQLFNSSRCYFKCMFIAVSLPLFFSSLHRSFYVFNSNHFQLIVRFLYLLVYVVWHQIKVEIDIPKVHIQCIFAAEVVPERCTSTSTSTITNLIRINSEKERKSEQSQRHCGKIINHG